MKFYKVSYKIRDHELGLDCFYRDVFTKEQLKRTRRNWDITVISVDELVGDFATVPEARAFAFERCRA